MITKVSKTTQNPCPDWLQPRSRGIRPVTRALALVLSLGFLFSVQAHAQNGQLHGEINSPDACATAGLSCGHGGAGPSAAAYGPLSTFGIVVLPGVVLATAGSFYQDPQGKYAAGAGLAGGVGLGLYAATYRLPTKFDKILATSAASALVAGSATQMYQFHQAWVHHLDTGYVPPSTQTDVKQIAISAGAAAAVTAVIGKVAFHQAKLTASKLQNAPAIIRTLAEVQISGTPQFMSARLTW